MSRVLDELVALLTLERIEENLFRGQSQDLGWGTVYGGQVLGQALAAALQTVPPDRVVHSIHAYFLLPGDVLRPIVYDVDRIRDGGSFTTRRVVALQKGQPIFNLAASFQVPEAGFEHADVMPDAPDPDTLEREDALPPAMMARMPKALLAGDRPFEMRAATRPPDLFAPTPQPPHRMVWLRTVGPLPDQPTLHSALLAYASDWSFLTTALFPHGVTWLTPGIQVASIDHVMWFHRPVRMDEWVLHVVDSPSAQGTRGLVRGRVFTRDGRLVASTAQEGLMRLRPPRA